MTKEERQEFIDRMEEIGDVWEYNDVKRVYGNRTLKEALESRMGDMHSFANIIGTIINR